MPSSDKDIVPVGRRHFVFSFPLLYFLHAQILHIVLNRQQLHFLALPCLFAYIAPHMRAHEGEAYHQSFEAPDAHILIVDDNDMNLIVVKKLLTKTSIQIDTARSGLECLRLTQNHHYDCILMDHLMPEMDGIECLHALRAQPGGLCQDTPVVALTANAGSDNQLLYRKEGFSGYLAKPVSGALLEA